MYRPPENSNRVKTIRSKFEQKNLFSSIEVKKEVKKNQHLNKSKTEVEITIQRPKLTQQLSDPNKRNNIKRTPAFRQDRSTAFQRSSATSRSTHFESKVAEIHKNNNQNSCDKDDKVVRHGSSNEKAEIVRKVTGSKPILIKSKSSHDFAYLRSKFDRPKEVNINNDNKRDLGLLYTEAIPKSSRVKPVEVVNKVDEEVTQDSNTLKLNTHLNIKTSSASSTNTIKSIFKRPLPSGPAPKKPPRIFIHNSPNVLEKNQSALYRPKEPGDNCTKPSALNRDPRYMLNKLEHALRTKKIKSLKIKPVNHDNCTTSGEDSDDSVLFQSKSSRTFSTLPQLPSDLTPDDRHFFNLNCLNGITCSKPQYEQIKEPSSSFFISCTNVEPVYAEPFEFPDTSLSSSLRKACAGENKRNTLYYLSSPLLCDIIGKPRNMSMRKIGDRNENDTVTQQDSKCRGLHHQISSENSSLSSFTSDLDSAASTPGEERENLEATLKMKRLIDAFETKTNVTSTNQKDFRTNRVEDFKMSIQKTLEGHGSSDCEDRDARSNFDKIVDKFQTYVKTMPKYAKCCMKEGGLFYCCLIVGWESKAPKIKFKFPKNVEVPYKIEELCYPETASGPLDRSNNAQCYSLVITNDRGERTFGYCRRVIPEGSTNCLPLAYCILSKYRSPRFYKKILAEVESRHGIPDILRDELISMFYCHKFPKPGQSIHIDLTNILNKTRVSKTTSTDKSSGSRDSLDLTSYVHVNKTGDYGTLNSLKRKGQQEEVVVDSGDVTLGLISNSNGKFQLTLTLHPDVRYEGADLRPLHQLPSHILLKVFASLLLERKVILISCVLSKLSACVDALQSILYPFSWPHTFIPILPQCLWDVVESPTPVVCGILSVAVVNEYKIEHGVVVDLDEGCILSEEGDEDSILCNSMKKAWEQGMALANSVPSNDYVHSVYLSDAYIKVFTHSLKNYKNYIVDGTLQKEAFIRNGKTKGVRRFLKWFTETTLFTAFIDSVISNPHSFALFDNKMETYSSDDSDLILSKLLEWKK